MIEGILKTIQRTLLTIINVKLYTWLRKYDAKSSNIVLIYPNFPVNLLKYFYSDAFINDAALINAVATITPSFNIQLGKKRAPVQKNIYLNINNRYTESSENYTEAVYDYTQNLSQNNNVFPKSYEILFWENKVFMHDKFEELGIPTPKTVAIEIHNLFTLPIGFSFPCLLKEIHSAGSNGVHKINSIEDAEIILTSLRSQNLQCDKILVQSLLFMDRDLRVILIGKEIVSYYWRINLGKEWKPTSTKHGSRVDFEYFPDEWKSYIIEIFQKLNINTGAFDLVWENNDYSKPPVVLEVSPSYQPNPVPPQNLKVSYGKYKSGFRLIDSWDSRFIKEVNRLKENLVRYNIQNKV